MYPPSKRKSTKYTNWLLFFLATGILLSLKIATVANDAHPNDEIPTGFGVERYASIWERNPFTLVAPVAPETHHSPFDKLFLTSWLKDGRRDVIFIQNPETNEVQKVTAEPTQGNLRLIALHLNPNPQFVEAVISDGKEQGTVKFRFDVQSPAGQTAPPVARIPNGGTAGQAPNPAQLTLGALSRPTSNPVDQPLTRRPGSGSSSAPMNGSRRASRGQGSEAVHLPLPPRTSGRSIPGQS
jgi:hypothetical protein